MNRIILQMEQERAALAGEKQALLQEKYGLREDLVRVEQEKMDLDTEKKGKFILFSSRHCSFLPFVHPFLH